MPTRAHTRRHASTATLGPRATRRRRGATVGEDARNDLSRADARARIVSTSKKAAVVSGWSKRGATLTTTTKIAGNSSAVSEETEEISLGELFEEYERAFGGDGGGEDALYAIRALPAPPRDVSSSALCEEEMNGFDAVHEESTVPYIAPEWLERSRARTVESAGSDNEEEGDDAENAAEYACHVCASKFLEEEEEEFMRSTMDLPADFISEPAALAARREARESALKSSQTCFEATAKSAMTTCEPFEGAFEPKMTMRRCESAQDFNEQYTCTAADGRVFHISSSLVTPSTSEADFVGGYGRSQLEDSAKGGGGTDAEDSDAELVAQSKRKGVTATPEKPSKKRKTLRRPDENGRRAKAHKTIKNDKGVRATDVVTANGKKVRRGCLHCGTIKTPQWRMGPEGKKTLCNACGVRFMKGIL